MLKLPKIAGVALAAAAAVALVSSASAFAQETQLERAQFSMRMTISAHGGGIGRGMCGEAGLAAAAEALGMTADELSTQLWGGETLSSLAETAGVDLQTVRDAVTAACEQAVRDAIEQAVEDGSLTREHADWLLEGLDNGYWGGGHDFGFGRRGFGPGGFRGHGDGFRGGAGFRGFPNSNRVTPDSSGA